MVGSRCCASVLGRVLWLRVCRLLWYRSGLCLHVGLISCACGVDSLTCMLALGLITLVTGLSVSVCFCGLGAVLSRPQWHALVSCVPVLPAYVVLSCGRNACLFFCTAQSSLGKGESGG